VAGIPGTKEMIYFLWSRIKRTGIEQLIYFLNESDFFQAPCSTKHHLAHFGGLAEHSLNVYNLLNEKVSRYGISVPAESVIICGLGHDLCKVNFYKEGGDACSDAQYNYLCSLWTQKQYLLEGINLETISALLEDGKFKRSVPAGSATHLIDWLKNKPQDQIPVLPVIYSVEDNLPLGHGEKSLSILQDFITLTAHEKLAIRWHMGAWDFSDYSGKWAFNNASKMTPLVTLLSTADYEANNILEREEGES